MSENWRTEWRTRSSNINKDILNISCLFLLVQNVKNQIFAIKFIKTVVVNSKNLTSHRWKPLLRRRSQISKSKSFDEDTRQLSAKNWNSHRIPKIFVIFLKLYVSGSVINLRQRNFYELNNYPWSTSTSYIFLQLVTLVHN